MEHQNTRKEWMTDAQYECWNFVCDLVYGEHHVCGDAKQYGRGICINMRNTAFATFDFDYLTRLVFMAHDRCIRAEIQPSGPGMLKLVLNKRFYRDGEMYERHPTIETALEKFKK